MTKLLFLDNFCLTIILQTKSRMRQEIFYLSSLMDAVITDLQARKKAKQLKMIPYADNVMGYEEIVEDLERELTKWGRFESMDWTLVWKRSKKLKTDRNKEPKRKLTLERKGSCKSKWVT